MEQPALSTLPLTERAGSEAQPKPPRYSIGDLSREFGVTTRAIRFYEDKGLLAPQRAGQQRIYGPRDRVRLKLILRGKRLGFSLREVAEMLNLYDAPQGEASQLRLFLQKIAARRGELLAQRSDIELVLGELEELEVRCEGLLGRAASA